METGSVRFLSKFDGVARRVTVAQLVEREALEREIAEEAIRWVRMQSDYLVLGPFLLEQYARKGVLCGTPD